MAVALHVAAFVALAGALVALLFLPGPRPLRWLRRRRPVVAVEEAAEEVVEGLLEAVSEAPESPAERRPLLRGWLHVLGAVISVPAGIWLVATTRDGMGLLAAIVFAAGQVALFAVSAIYHVLTWPSVGWQKADHATVFVFIACAYTPLGLLAPTGSLARNLLLAVWVCALFGVLLKAIWIGAPAWMGLALYSALGWAPGLIVLIALRGTVGWEVTALILASGVVYTIGSLIYATRRLDPWPRVFGFHEIWHTATLVAAALQWVAITRDVIPAIHAR
jgi:hemolysin III